MKNVKISTSDLLRLASLAVREGEDGAEVIAIVERTSVVADEDEKPAKPEAGTAGA